MGRQFRYVLQEAGFHSEDAVPRRGGLRVSGGFTVEPHPAGCRVWHCERYLLPWVAAPLKPAVAAHVRWTQRREMRDLAALIEASAHLRVWVRSAAPPHARQRSA